METKDAWETLILDALDRYVDDMHDGNLKRAAQSLGVKYETFRSWCQGSKSPTLSNLSPILGVIGFPPPNQGEPTESCGALRMEVTALRKKVAELQAENTRMLERENELLRKIISIQEQQRELLGGGIRVRSVGHQQTADSVTNSKNYGTNNE